MTAPVRYGATLEEWYHFGTRLNLRRSLLPSVGQPGLPIHPGSALSSAYGKTPSQIRDGAVVGIPGWPTHETTDEELSLWISDGRHNLCVNTSDTRAIDLDITSSESVARIVARLTSWSGFLFPTRTRPNSSKCLLLYQVSGDLPKVIIPVDSGVIEMLGTGQQCVLCGTHPSGVRYEWVGGLPLSIPKLLPHEYREMMQMLIMEFATDTVLEPRTRVARRSPGAGDGDPLPLPAPGDDPTARFLFEKDWVISTGRHGRLNIRCPWAHEHTPGTGGDSSTVYMPAGTNEFEQGHFDCKHASHVGKTTSDYLIATGYMGDGFEVIDTITDVAAQAEHSQRASYQLLTVADLAARPPLSWRIKHVLPEIGLVVIYGPSGSGKGFVVIDMAMAIATGSSWFGQGVKAGPVVYCALEGEEGIPQRVKAYCAVRPAVGAQVRFLLQPFNLLKKSDVESLAKAIIDTECGGGVTILDTLNRATPGCDENDSKDMGRTIAAAKDLQVRVGGLVLLVHHTGKDLSKGMRGHSSLHAAVDCALEVTRAGDRRSWCLAKSKDGRDGNAHAFRLDVVELGKDEDGDPITSCVVEPELDAGSQLRQVKIPRGGNQKIIWQAMRECLQTDSPLESENWPKSAPLGRACIELENAIVKTRDRLTCQPDQRTRSTRTAITGLVNTGLLVLKEGWLWEP